MAASLYLIRHGQTEGSEEKRYKGTMDVPLSSAGVEQVKKTALHFKGIIMARGQAIDAIYSSNLIRAQRSAEIISGIFGMGFSVEPELRERDFGIWEGMTFDELHARYPDEFKAWAMDPLRFSPLGGESTMEVKDRVMGAVQKLLIKHKDRHIAIVAHGGVNRVIICHFLGMPLENIFRLEQDFACINTIDFHEGMPVASLINGIPYE